MANITGWGRGTWGEGTWSNPLPVEVTGVSATGTLGAAQSDTGIQFGVTGVSTTASISGFNPSTITLTVTELILDLVINTTLMGYNKIP